MATKKTETPKEEVVEEEKPKKTTEKKSTTKKTTEAKKTAEKKTTSKKNETEKKPAEKKTTSKKSSAKETEVEIQPKTKDMTNMNEIPANNNLYFIFLTNHLSILSNTPKPIYLYQSPQNQMNNQSHMFYICPTMNSYL